MTRRLHVHEIMLPCCHTRILSPSCLCHVHEICECVSWRQYCCVSWPKQRISGNPMAISPQSTVWPPIQIHAFLRRNERRRATNFPLSLEIPLLYKSLRAFHLQIWRPELCVLHQYVQRLTTMRIKVNWGLKYKKTNKLQNTYKSASLL